MSKRDVRDMLGLEKEDATPVAKTKKPSKKEAESLKGESSVKGKVAVGKLAKKNRLSRDLKSLQASQRAEVIDESPIVPSFVGPMKKKAKSGKRVVPWTKFEYVNKEGSGSLTLRHVRPLDDPNKNTNVFLRYDKKNDILMYDDAQYEKLLQSSSWSREETDALMRLAQRFDGRLVVVHDRWEGTKARSLDEIKARYYEVQKRLASPESEMGRFVFDFDASVLRKRHAEILYNRTGNDVWEEFEAKKAFEPVAAELAKAKAAPGRVRTLMSALDQGLKEYVSSASAKTDSKKNDAWSPNDAAKPKKKGRPSKPAPGGAAIASLAGGIGGAAFAAAVDNYMRSLNVPLRPSANKDAAAAHADVRAHVMLVLDMQTLLQQKKYEVELLKLRIAALNGEEIEVESPKK